MNVDDDLPPEGSALRKLGARLTELLEEDQWAECERMLLDAAAEAKADNARMRALLRRGMRQLEAWQEKYGDWQPQWLPPAGDVRWAEDVSEALATPNVKSGTYSTQRFP